MLAVEGAHRTLAGRYELREVIGRGGMGIVYRATDLVLGRSVAVKVLPGLLSEQDPASVARFEREARAIAALNHPAVVAIYDTGADETTRFIVMEYIAGRSLATILSQDGPLEPDRATAIAARVADALAAAHAAGIVHRDIKPANVMVADDGSVKVLDFGIARAVDASALTHTASMVGTAAYMAPEQALGKAADARSDVYALGCVLYALIAGEPPFTGEVAAAILHQHANVAPRSLRAGNDLVSPALERLVQRMLAKSPDDRPQSAAQVRDLLTSTSRDRLAPPVSAEPTVRLPQTAATRPLPGAALARRRPILIVGGVLAALVAAVVVIALASAGGSPHSAAGAGGGPGLSKSNKRRARSHATSTTHAAASSTPATTATTSATTATTRASSTAAQPSTVSGAAAALTALTTRDAQSASIDQQAAQQITNRVSDILNSYEMGQTGDAQHKLSDLSQQVAMLEQQGHITSSAAPALNAAVTNLGAALSNAPPASTSRPQPSAHPTPPGHGGQPPGQEKQKHSKH